MTRCTNQIQHQGCFKGLDNTRTAQVAPPDLTTKQCRHSQAGPVHVTTDRKATRGVWTVLSQIKAVYCIWDPVSFQIALQTVDLTAGNQQHFRILVHHRCAQHWLKAPNLNLWLPEHCQNLCADQSKTSEPDQERIEKAPKLRGANLCKDTQCHSIKTLLAETCDIE